MRFQGLWPAGCWAVLPCLAASFGLRPEVASADDFAPSRRVSDGSGKCTQAATGLDLANNAYISSVIDEKILVKIIGPNLDAQVPVTIQGLGQGDPDFAASVRGITYMTFSQIDAQSIEEGKEIWITTNEGGGGVFTPPQRITKNRVDDYAPRLVLDRDGKYHLVWAQRVGDETRVLYWSEILKGKDPIPVAFGDYPHLFVDEQGMVHVVYSRERNMAGEKSTDLFYNNNAGGSFTNELQVTTTAHDPESSASIGGDPNGNIFLCYESRSSLYYVTKAPGAGFVPSRLVDTGGVLDPRMRVRSRGQVVIVYEKHGDLYYVVGQSSFLAPPVQICTDTQTKVETHPSLEVDLVGNLHVSYIIDGDVYYTNNAAKPVADFSGIPTRGEVPLTVRFGDLSRGQIQLWDWDFGDGETSSESNPVHTYTQPGRYTVRLKVTAPGAVESITEKEDFIFVEDPYYTMKIPDQKVVPGQVDVWFPVITERKDRVKGFQLVGTYDPNFLHLKDFERAFTGLAARPAPELFERNDHGTYFEVGCIFEYNDPFDPVYIFLPPANDQTLLQLVFDVDRNAPEGAKTQVELVNNRAVSRLANMFISADDHTLVPSLTSSTVEVIVVQPPFPRFFLRGDVDDNGELQLTDAVRILSYLFTGGEPPRCLDSADFNDKGRIDISSAISLLNYLFLGGPQPAVPFPIQGLDPSPDDLGDCH